MTHFTPLSAWIGGLIIGVSALLLFLFNGKIAGISGIFSRSIFEPKKEAWQLYFLIGLMVGPFLVAPLGFLLPTEISISWPHLLIGGFLVGLGSKVGSGCTSGHGICGIGRGSIRSIVATLIFMLSAFLTVWVTH